MCISVEENTGRIGIGKLQVFKNSSEKLEKDWKGTFSASDVQDH